MMLGLYALIARGNMVKKIVGLNIFQTSLFVLYISMGKIDGGTAPILIENAGGAAGGAGGDIIYANPLPHVLILTAIVVGVATTALGYALIVRIYERFGTIEDDEIAPLMEDDQ